ncbi:hydroxymethylglutaryl-CoA lyase [Ilumatobacter nonamiensis]|uniref:hydroxymethylglutaryl-CoA lyase n=1 Tax=Ilumatobacter nonamiensis TaxID=467093 RepID=UPI00034A9F8D|nr:hydroxymethylglutaryl-CoA lyase [Ilumatobacter nonamiensis]
MPEPTTIVLRDVTLRDGLQDEDPIPTEHKLAIFEALVAAGVRDLELTSFVRPDRVPATADAEALCAATAGRDVVRWGLVLNERGAMRALEAGLTDLQFVISVSDAHSHANAGRSTAEAVEALTAVCEIAGAAAARVEVTLATAFGCPFEQRVDPDRVIDVSTRAIAAGVTAVSLADTVGTAVPADVASLVSRVTAEVTPHVGAHFHDTRGLGVANALAALDAGVNRLDASAGGLGGCPFAPGASGNVALEDLAHVCEESGLDTGLSVPAVITAAEMACDAVGRTLTTHVGVAGPRFANR